MSKHTLILTTGVCATMKALHTDPIDNNAVYTHLAHCAQCQRNALLLTEKEVREWT